MKRIIGRAADILQEEGPRSLARRARLRGVQLLSQLNYDPVSIWDREWDLLIVLDACRLDLLRSVENEFDFLQSAAD